MIGALASRVLGFLLAQRALGRIRGIRAELRHARGACLSAAAAVLASFFAPAAASAEPCEDCFAVFVMPDTQLYAKTDEGIPHYDLVTRWICANKDAWREPSTGKEMPIAMVIQLGDVVQNADRQPSQWLVADLAFDNLDACGVPYLVAVGNHDIDVPGNPAGCTAGDCAFGVSEGYNEYFGVERWSAYQCADPASCSGEANDWFVGGGDPIPANSRRYGMQTGPPVDQPGRHRAGLIRARNGQRYLFIAVDPIVQSAAERAWLDQVMGWYRGVPTVLFNHWGFGALNLSDGDRLWKSHPQVFLTVHGHWTPADERTSLVPGPGNLGVHHLFRNYQTRRARPECPTVYGGGWNAIAVFDPSEAAIRVRSYRIEDTDDDCTHDGTPELTENLEMDFKGIGERTLDYAFLDLRPDGTVADNCPCAVNPDQEDADGDGVGDLCDNCVLDWNPRLGTLDQPEALPFQQTSGGQLDDDLDGFGNQCDGDFVDGGQVVAGSDVTAMRASFNKDRSGTNCGPQGNLPCAPFDLDNAGQLIAGPDVSRLRQLFNKPRGPKCSTCPLVCENAPVFQPAVAFTGSSFYSDDQVLGYPLSGTCFPGLDVALSGDLATPRTVPCEPDGAFGAAIDFAAPGSPQTIVATQTPAVGLPGMASRQFVRAPLLDFVPPCTVPADMRHAAEIEGVCELPGPIELRVSGAFPENSPICDAGAFGAALDLSDAPSRPILTAVQDVAVAVQLLVVVPALEGFSLVPHADAGSFVIEGTCDPGASLTLAGAGLAQSYAPDCVPATECGENCSFVCEFGVFAATVAFTPGAGLKPVIASQTLFGRTVSAERSYLVVE